MPLLSAHGVPVAPETNIASERPGQNIDLESTISENRYSRSDAEASQVCLEFSYHCHMRTVEKAGHTVISQVLRQVTADNSVGGCGDFAGASPAPLCTVLQCCP